MAHHQRQKSAASAKAAGMAVMKVPLPHERKA